MDYRPIERAPGAFQQPVTAEQIRAMCRRAFGKHVHVRGAVELGLGSYNSTFRVDLDHLGDIGDLRDVIDIPGATEQSATRPVILRVAPEQARRYRSEREFMRNEYASLPFLAPIAALLPRTLAIDFTHEIVGRDYMFQTMLGGVPAPEGLAAYPRPRWASFFAQLGAITRDIHAVGGERFGRVAGLTYTTWTEAVLASLSDTATDLEEAGLDAADLRQVAAVAEGHSEVLEEVKKPRMLHGDLWTVNVMVEAGAAEPTICGVFDCDRTSWGDPEADWTIRMAGRRPGTERDAFWTTYGPLATTPEAALRRQIYRARHVGAIRLERYRLGGMRNLRETYDEMRDVLGCLNAAS
ncbi:phosphotransferase family protein [Actinopolymorpha pittospori]